MIFFSYVLVGNTALEMLLILWICRHPTSLTPRISLKFSVIVFLAVGNRGIKIGKEVVVPVVVQLCPLFFPQQRFFFLFPHSRKGGTDTIVELVWRGFPERRYPNTPTYSRPPMVLLCKPDCVPPLVLIM